MTASKEASIANYERTADKIRASAEGLPQELLLWQPGPGKWSINEIVGHLMDSNIVNSYRIRKIVAEPTEALASFAHEEWVDRQRFNETDLSELLAGYDAITRYNAILLRKLNADQWALTGMKADEPISVSHLIDQFICKHVDKHLGQIERNKAAYAAR